MLELRFPLPVDVAPAFTGAASGGRPYIIRSLGTSDVRLGNAKADVLRAKLRGEIATVRAAQAAPDLDGYLVSLFDSELRQWESQSVSLAREALKTNTLQRAEASRERSAAARNTWAGALLSDDLAERRAAASWAAERYFSEVGMTPGDSPAFLAVVDRCADTLAEAQIAINDPAAGRRKAEPSAALSAWSPTPVPVHTNHNSVMTLSDYFNRVYMPVLRQGKGARGERMLSGKDRAVRLFGDLVGDLPIGSITKRHIWMFNDELLKLPDVNVLTAQWRKLSAKKQIQALASGDFVAETLSPKTVNKHLSGLRTVLDFAERRDDIVASPAAGVRAIVPPEEDTGRAFSTDELNRIFRQPLFSGCSEGLLPKGLQKSGPVKVRDDRFWIPLVLLFTGARSSEVAGLQVDDVIVDHEFPHFIFRPSETRRLKNLQSKRMVPVHLKLVELGFVDFANAQLLRSEGQFFPLAIQQYFNESVTGTRQKKALSNSPIMRQFNRTILADADARGNGGSVKCFRNTFEQEAAATIPSDEVRRRLTGRDLKSSVQIYTQNVPDDPIKCTAQLRMLSEQIQKICYGGVSLDHLAG
jgi:integrase